MKICASVAEARSFGEGYSAPYHKAGWIKQYFLRLEYPAGVPTAGKRRRVPWKRGLEVRTDKDTEPIISFTNLAGTVLVIGRSFGDPLPPTRTWVWHTYRSLDDSEVPSSVKAWFDATIALMESLADVKELNGTSPEVPPAEPKPQISAAEAYNQYQRSREQLLGRIASKAAEVRTATEQLDALVMEARSTDVSWRAIGDAVGISGPSAFKRWDPKGKEGQRQAQSRLRAGLNDPCPCGSGKKYRHCHAPRNRNDPRTS